MIPLVVLAAGRSSRMGRTKAALPLRDGETFLSRIIRTAREAGIARVVVVVGHDADTVRAAAGQHADLEMTFVYNPHYASGQLSSVLTGVDAVDRPEVRAMLLTLVDVPLVASATIRAVIERYEATGAAVVRPVHGEQHGHPVLLDRSLFTDLRACDPQLGAKPIVRRHASAAGDVAVVDEGAFLDIDTPDDYAKVIRPAAPG